MAILKRAQIRSMDLIDVHPAGPDVDKSTFYKTLLDQEMRAVIGSMFSQNIQKHYEIVGLTPPDITHGEPNWVIELERRVGDALPAVTKFAQIAQSDVEFAVGEYLGITYAKELDGQDIRVAHVAPLMMEKYGSSPKWVCKIYSYKKT